MPLIRIEVENFKSYRGKQIIGPFRSFNSVIGPNGSGKSNLMDAISFVLGVKSSQLRSSQLKQLIYQGRRLQGSGEHEGSTQGPGEAVEADVMEQDDDDADEGQAATAAAAAQGAGGASQSTPQKATVIAVYEDKNGAEYHFQRSVTMSGSSEYRVNGRAMSAGAYNDRLKAFNILVKAKNFLVFQGDVEAVAAQNPKDLSRFIDQISGSLEYKEAYEAAKSAQTRTHDQLNHVASRRRNIIVELKHFKDQKGEADRYTRLQRQKRDAVVQHLLWTLFHAERSTKELNASVEKKNRELASRRDKLTKAEEEVKKARQAHGQVSQQALDQQKTVRRRNKEAEKLQPDIDAAEQKILHCTKRMQSAQEIVHAVEADIAKYTASVAQYQRDYESAKDAVNRAAEEQTRISAKRGLTLSEADMHRYHELRAESSQRKIAERQQLESLTRDVRAHQSSQQSLQDKISALEAQLTKLEKDGEIIGEQQAKVTRRRREVQEQLRTKRSDDEALRRKKESVDKRIETLNSTLEECLRKLNEAGTYQRETEKESRTKETIASLRRMYPGVHGRIVDLCRPTQRKYETAVSTVLGKNADAIVVQTQQEAIDCIEYFKRQRAGQATFIPLDTAQVQDVNDRLRSISPGARLAFDIVQYDPTVEKAVRYACGNALVCDDLDIARSICYDKQQKLKAVTLEGTVIHKSGLISGGQGSEGSNTRWEEQEIEGLKRQRDRCLSELKALGTERYELSRNSDNVDKIARCEAELLSLEDELSAITKRLQGARDEKQAVEKQLAELQPNFARMQQKHRDASSQAAALQMIINREDDAVFGDFCRHIGVTDIREYEERHLRLVQKQNDARLEYELQMKRLEHAIRFEEDQLTQARARLDTNARVIQKQQTRLDELQNEREELKKKLDEVRVSVEEMREVFARLQQEEAESKQTLQVAQKEAEIAQSELVAHVQEVSLANVEIERLASKRRAILRRCRLEGIELPVQSGSLDVVPMEGDDTTLGMDEEGDEEESFQTECADPGPDFGIRIDYSNLTPQEKRDGSDTMGASLEESVETARSELERLGAPNAKVQERLGDSEARLADADDEYERARRDNKRAQEEYVRLRKIRCDLYHRAFDHISTKVDEVYKDLTSSKAAPKGGNAYLDLQNDTEPYLDGVLYTAMPPTKSFRGIDQLSGGEKSVAALALLFAVHSYRPAPFFVLDEVDAALDAQNVARVAAYIRSHASAEFQFIVISLKAMLYEKSEALLGVMRNQQVNSSRTFTLDLEQYA